MSTEELELRRKYDDALELLKLCEAVLKDRYTYCQSEALGKVKEFLDKEGE